MTIVNPIDLDTVTLAKGAHDPGAGMCVMEAVAYVAGEPWTDHPACASPVISAFMRSWNDALLDEDRNRLLKPYITRLVGTASTPQVEDARAWMAVDWSSAPTPPHGCVPPVWKSRPTGSPAYPSSGPG